MRQEQKDDRLFIIEDNTDMSEGYLKRMKTYCSVPKKSRLLAVAFGYMGKLRISNAIGYMKTFRDVKTLDELSIVADGGYNFIAVYYVVENLDGRELPDFINQIKKMLLPDGKIMVVVDIEKKRTAMNELMRECKAQGLSEAGTDLWKVEPLNYWDHADRGKVLAKWQKRLPLLRCRIARTASVLLTQEVA